MFKVLSIFFIAMACCTAVFAQDGYDLRADVYSKLKVRDCSAPLLEAKCQGAQVMKAYIEGLRDAGSSKDDIFLKTVGKFSLDVVADPQLKTHLETRLAQGMDSKRPVIAVDNREFDFGPVTRTQGKVSHIFKLVNNGQSDLIVKNVYSACSCTTAALKVGKAKSAFFDTRGAPKDWQMVVKPGKSAELEVALDLSHKNVTKGDLERKTFILSNDPLYPSISVAVKAQVSE